jgi:hypothetical protein
MRNLSLYLTVCLLGIGCGDEHDGTSTIETQIIEGCKHLNYGNPTELNASEMEVTAPSIHARYDLKLAAPGQEMMPQTEAEATAGDDAVLTFNGLIAFESMGGTHMLFLSKSAEIEVRNGAAERLEPVRVDTMSDGCEQAAIIVVIELPVGNYTFDISNAVEKTMEFVIHAYDASHAHAGHSDH